MYGLWLDESLLPEPDRFGGIGFPIVLSNTTKVCVNLLHPAGRGQTWPGIILPAECWAMSSPSLVESN